jgi:aminopeptidase N
MSKADIDQLRLTYKKATDEWVDTIRAEEALATPDHSMVAMEHWDAAHFREEDAHAKATKAREAYKDALRGVNYGI